MSTEAAGRRGSLAAMLGVALGFALGACASDGGDVEDPTATRRVTAADFASGPAEKQQAARAVERSSGVGSDIRVGETSARKGIDDARAVVGDPARPTARDADRDTPPAPLAEPGLGTVDVVVGQINGRPVYASDFFAPMDARLRAAARTMTRSEWLDEMRKSVRGALVDKLRDELLLAEFESSLTPEMKRGLLAFAEDLRGNIVRGFTGSRDLASRRLLEQEGLTLDEKVKAERDRVIIIEQLRKVLGDRAYVSWREVELEYERLYGSFNPSGKARVRLIQAPMRDAERVERVRGALAAGEDFGAVATRESAFNADKGGLLEVALEGPYEQATIFGAAPLNDAARALSPGQVSEPIEFRGSMCWIKFDGVERRPGLPLYDAQLLLYEALQTDRFNDEQRRYFTQLKARSSLSDEEKMLDRLQRLAVERYLGAAQVAPAPAAAPR